VPEVERENEPEEVTAQAAGFGAAPAKAVPVNAPVTDAAKGQKRGRDEEEEEEEDAGSEMDVSDDSD